MSESDGNQQEEQPSAPLCGGWSEVTCALTWSLFVWVLLSVSFALQWGGLFIDRVAVLCAEAVLGRICA